MMRKQKRICQDLKNTETSEQNPPNTSGLTESYIRKFSFNHKNVNELTKEDSKLSAQRFVIAFNSLYKKILSCSNACNDSSNAGSKPTTPSEMQLSAEKCCFLITVISSLADTGSKNW